MTGARAQGLREASEVLERALAETADPPAEPAKGGLVTVAEAWTDLLRYALQRMAPPAAEPPFTAGGTERLVRLTFPGPRAGDTFWIHNGSESDVGALTFHCDQLTGSDGVALHGLRVHFDPAGLPSVAPSESRAVVVALAGPPPERTGVYRSVIRTEGAMRLWLPLEIAVLPC